jgi:hypothetical protein
VFPTELMDYPQWVVWKYATTPEGKLTKLPYSSRTGNLASVVDPATWTDYKSAVATIQQYPDHFSGLGFVLSDDDPYCFIDLDDPEDNFELLQRQIAIAESFESYSETSPSGKGLHIIIKAEVPGGRKRGKVEIYSSQRYFTMTGNTYKDLPIAERQYYADLLWKELDDPRKQIDQLLIKDEPESSSDEEIYVYAAKAENGEKFETLWKGDWQKYYSSQSEADFALINIISFYSRNFTQIKRMFKRSELARRKKSTRDNYIDPMIRRSFDNQPPSIPMEQMLMETANKLAKRDALAEREIATKPLFQGPLFANTDSVMDWTLPPGLVGDIAQFIFNAAPRPVKEIALGGAIGLVAGICGQAYNVSGTGLNQYILILAKTGTGKEAAASGIDKLMQKIKDVVPASNEFIGPAEIASGQALLKYLDKHHSFVSVVGEFGLALQQMCSPMASPSQKSLRKTLLSLYNKSGNHDIQRGMIYSDNANNTDNVKSPAFSILGESTPETFYINIDESIVSEGLLPRFTCIEYKGERPALNEKHLTCEPEPDLLNKLAELTANSLMLSHNKKVINIELDVEATKLAYEFDKLCDARINTSDMEVSRQLWNRGHIKALKLAGLIAIGVNPYHPVITLEHLAWAIMLVERDIKNVLIQFESGKAGKDFSEVNQLVELSGLIGEYIKKPYLGLEKYRIIPLMHQDRVIPQGYIQQRMMQRSCFRNDRAGATNAIARALKALCDEGSLQQLKDMDVYKRYGRTMKSFLVLDPQRFL